MKKCDKCWGTGVEPNHYYLGMEARERRRKLNLTLGDMSKSLGISTGYLSYLESGKRKWTEELYRKATR
jgi:transcriptional regulator with XRE-family HTH domain